MDASGASGEIKFIKYGAFGLALKYFKRDLDEKNEPNHPFIETKEAANEFKLEAVHEKRFQTYIVRAFEMKYDPKRDRVFIVAEKAEGDLKGKSFLDVLNENRNETRWFVMHDCFRGLQALTSIGYVHRDIKPDNILFFKRRDNKVAFKLGDLGASTPVGYGNENIGAVSLGTYPPPIAYFFIKSALHTGDRTFLDAYIDLKLDSAWIDYYAMAVVSYYLEIATEHGDIDKLNYLGHSVLEDNDYVKFKFGWKFKINSVTYPKLNKLNTYLNTIVDVMNKPWEKESQEVWETFFKRNVDERDEINKLVNSDARDLELTNDAEYIYPDTSVDWICDALASTSIKQTNAGPAPPPPPAPTR